ncbi:hypothetical protein CRENBAI_010025 [Crenichthys baileyi]|uniref:Secreted protein n=1 Tax=Crenichthys baileyi TaxID=28760 RepID=A0AAV9SMH5_9TELE
MILNVVLNLMVDFFKCNIVLTPICTRPDNKMQKCCMCVIVPVLLHYDADLVTRLCFVACRGASLGHKAKHPTLRRSSLSNIINPNRAEIYEENVCVCLCNPITGKHHQRQLATVHWGALN